MTEPAIWPPWAIYDADAQNEEPLLSDHPLKLASSILALEGHINGAARLGDSGDAANPAPLNPSGDYGHDHSGGVFGRPLFKSVATFSNDPCNRLSSYIVGHELPGTSRHARHIRIGTQPPGGFGFGWAAPCPVWIPPCPAGEQGAYARAAVRIDIEVTSISGILQSADDLRVVIRNDHPGVPKMPDYNFYHLDMAWTLPATTGDKTVSVDGDSEWLEVVPGQVNPLTIGHYFELDSGGSNRSWKVAIDEVELGVSSRHT